MWPRRHKMRHGAAGFPSALQIRALEQLDVFVEKRVQRGLAQTIDPQQFYKIRVGGSPPDVAAKC